MKLNELQPAVRSKRARKRVGRGAGSGLGKTGGRGHKGQKARSGGYTKVGFEGGQMPLQRRLPKVGFHSRKAERSAEIRLYELAGLDVDVIDLPTLKQAGVIADSVTRAKVIAKGELDRAVTLKGVSASKGARTLIEKAGGQVE